LLFLLFNLFFSFVFNLFFSFGTKSTDFFNLSADPFKLALPADFTFDPS